MVVRKILEKYLNVVQFGKDLHGVKAATDFYFHKRPAELNIVESAFLAFLLPSPEKYSKSYFKKDLTDFARKRIDQIIEYLFQFHRIDELEYKQAKQDLINFLKPQLVTAEPPTDNQTQPGADQPEDSQNWDQVDEENVEPDEN